MTLSSFTLDPDFGWHIKLGQDMTERGEILREDVYSWTMNGYVWGNSYVLYELILFRLHTLFGYTNLVLLFALVSAFGFLILVKRYDILILLFVILASVLSLSNLAVRPHVISFVLFGFLLLLIERKLYERPIYSILGFLGFAIWANLHRGFVFGLFFLGLYFVLDWLETKKINRRALIFFFLCILGTFVTPFPLRIWSGGVADDFKTWENLWYIAEWFPSGVFFPTNILLAVTGGVLVYMFFTQKTIDPKWFILSAVVFSLAFLSVSLVMFWVAVFVFLVSRHFTAPPVIGEMRSVDKLMLGFVCLLCAVCVGFYFVLKFWDGSSFHKIVEREGYPVGALNFINENKISGRMFNEYKWGGYLIWSGNGPVFIDGRMAGWKKNGESILSDYVSISSGKCDVLLKYDIEYVLVGRDFNLKCFSEFRKIYEDKQALVLLKKAD